MERDQKIGLALGILLVGAVAAFFFRHEEPPDAPLPELRTAADLDHKIAERKQAPYLQPAAPESADTSADPFPSESLQESPAALPPDPIPLTGHDLEIDPLAGSTSAVPAGQPVQEWTYHIVQRGETLSSIAARYLGSAARYEELFALNADRLHDANDLRVGMELRVPNPVASRPGVPRTAGLDDRRSSREAAPNSSQGSERVPAPGTLPTESRSPLQFEPYGRSPLTPQGAPPSSSALDPKEAARKKLTQLPPRGDVSPPR
uniref:LysM peptidoglycan-binding domain-containing protein n=1 Tax=Schlesneria paludicola TaxID=360056 RepID=A0A7C4LN91_9PLAN